MVTVPLGNGLAAKAARVPKQSALCGGRALRRAIKHRRHETSRTSRRRAALSSHHASIEKVLDDGLIAIAFERATRATF